MKRIIIALLILFSTLMFAQTSLVVEDTLKNVIKKIEPKEEKITPVPPEIDKQKPDSTEVNPLIESTKEKKVSKKDIVDRTKLDENAFQIIERLNVKNMELRDVLRGIAYQYHVNIVAGNDLIFPVTLTLANLTVIDCILFLVEEYDLKLKQRGNILRIFKEKKEEISSTSKELNIQVSEGKLNVDILNEDIQKVIKGISQTGKLNIILEHGVKGNISGFFQEIDIIKGIELLLKNNGFLLREKDNVYYVSYDRKTYSGKDGSKRSLWVTVNENSRISFDLIEADIMQVLQEISQQMDINLITYGTPTGKISAKCTEITLDEALNFLFKETEFTFKVEDGVYIIGNKNIRGLVTNKLIKLNHIKAEGILELLPDIVKRNATIKIIKEQNALMAIATNDVIVDLENFLSQIDHPTPQILIEALVVDFNSSDIRGLGMMMGTNRSQADTTGWSNFSLLDIGINKEGYFYTQQDGKSVNEQLSNFSNWIGAKNIGILPDNFYIQIQAMESEGRANVRSRPQIATLNGHTASISIGTTQYYILKSTTPVTSTEQIITQETERFEKVEANITLSITPWVSASGEVTVEIHPEFKTPIGAFNADTPPTINTRVIDSTVRLKDGETIILGGLIEEKKSKSFYKIPILGDIPILGYLFRSRSKSDIKTEMMIYITPHVFYGDATDAAKWNNLKSGYNLDNK